MKASQSFLVRVVIVFLAGAIVSAILYTIFHQRVTEDVLASGEWCTQRFISPGYSAYDFTYDGSFSHNTYETGTQGKWSLRQGILTSLLFLDEVTDTHDEKVFKERVWLTPNGQLFIGNFLSGLSYDRCPFLLNPIDDTEELQLGPQPIPSSFE